MRWPALILAVGLLAAGGCATPESASRSDALATDQTTGSGSAPPATAGGSGGGASGGVPQAGQTSEERRAAIEQRLEESLGGFDAQLKQEQERTAKERDARAASAAGSAGSEPTQAGEPKGRRGVAEDGQRSGDLHSIKPSGSNAGGGSGNGKSARELPDGSDDDIIARRLRQAAEQESDPELKEKLWHEYLEYRKNGQTK